MPTVICGHRRKFIRKHTYNVQEDSNADIKYLHVQAEMIRPGDFTKIAGDCMRCCRNCRHFNRKDDTCEEGGLSEIGDPGRELTGDDCNGFNEAIA